MQANHHVSMNHFTLLPCRDGDKMPRGDVAVSPVHHGGDLMFGHAAIHPTRYQADGGRCARAACFSARVVWWSLRRSPLNTGNQGAEATSLPRSTAFRMLGA